MLSQQETSLRNAHPRNSGGLVFMTLLRASLGVILVGLLLSTPILTSAQKDSRTKDAARHASDAAKRLLKS